MIDICSAPTFNSDPDPGNRNRVLDGGCSSAAPPGEYDELILARQRWGAVQKRMNRSRCYLGDGAEWLGLDDVLRGADWRQLVNTVN